MDTSIFARFVSKFDSFLSFLRQVKHILLQFFSLSAFFKWKEDCKRHKHQLAADVIYSDTCARIRYGIGKVR